MKPRKSIMTQSWKESVLKSRCDRILRGTLPVLPDLSKYRDREKVKNTPSGFQLEQAQPMGWKQRGKLADLVENSGIEAI